MRPARSPCTGLDTCRADSSSACRSRRSSARRRRRSRRAAGCPTTSPSSWRRPPPSRCRRLRASSWRRRTRPRRGERWRGASRAKRTRIWHHDQRMSLARLVVIEGPDAGREFELPMRGGRVGREAGSLVKLTAPPVSRQHGLLELRDGALTLVSEKRTLINGREVAVHPLEAGDEIVIGATKMAYLPVEGVAVTRAASHVTMEVSTAAMLALTGRDDRARRHLAALAQLGERL